ncbi:hypothetical protein ACVIHF_000595 [Bradyrhizobium sp. USDA 4506]
MTLLAVLLRLRTNNPKGLDATLTTKTGQLWAYAADDRPWGGLEARLRAEAMAASARAELSDNAALIAHLELQIEKLKRANCTGSAPSARRG